MKAFPRLVAVPLALLTLVASLAAQETPVSPQSAENLASAPFRDPHLPTEQRAADLLGRMTLEEKVAQLQQRVIHASLSEEDTAVLRTVGAGDCMVKSETAALLNQAQHLAVEQSRLGIPLIFAADVIHGYRTTFPISLGLSCAWTPELFEQSQAVAARETRAAGFHWTFAPMCEVARDPRWGRVAETCGEDPYLAARYTEAAVRGFQGSDPAAGDRVAACLKHFTGYSASVGGRDYNETQIPEWNLRNVYLPSFKAGVDAGALGVMSAFNANDGIPSTANRHLLTDILRHEWKYPGMVISDWESVHEVVNWGYAADPDEAARLCVTAGTDVEMGSDYHTLGQQVKDGKIPVAVIDQAVRRVLEMKLKLGLFEHPYTDETAYDHAILRPEAIALARDCVARSCVLLKNKDNAALPLAKSVQKIALIGPFGDDQAEMIGCWPSEGKAKDVVTLATGLRAKLPPGVQLQVVKGCNNLGDGSLQTDEAVRAAREADVVIMALGEPLKWSGECASRATLGVSGRQQELFDAVAATGKPIVVVLFCGRVLAATELIDKAAAVLVAWQPGVQAGNGLADVLCGDTAPSGKLTMSWPRAVGQLPLYYNGYNTGRPQPRMQSYKDLPNTPLYQFGHGLTYTTFSYGPAQVVPGTNGAPDQVTATVTNSGPRAGEEIAEFYVRQMVCAAGARPVQELRGFNRVSLQPGERKVVSFPLTRDALGYWDRDGAFRADSGKYHLWVAPEARSGQEIEYEAKF